MENSLNVLENSARIRILSPYSRWNTPLIGDASIKPSLKASFSKLTITDFNQALKSLIC